MKKIIIKIKLIVTGRNFKKISAFLLFFLIVSAVSFLPQPANAAEGVDWVTNKLILGVAHIIYALVSFLGKFALYLIGWIAQVASWKNFIDVDTVMNGWTIVRDLCNMFFILILLVIAFATILRAENYPLKKLLPKLLIMAVLINFSKTICGLIIDFSQVIMLTFVSSFSGGGGGNFVSMLGINHLLEFAQQKDNNGSTLPLETIWGLLAALAFSVVTLIVMVVILGILVMRVMMLWIYIILSPLAYLLSAFPQGQKYAQQWWSEFTQNVITGPILAFFLWLSLSTAQSSSARLSLTTNVTTAPPEGIISGMMDDKIFQTYIISIGLLIGGLIVTQKAGGVAGSLAGKGLGWAKKAGGAAVAGTATAALITGKMATRTSMRGVGAGISAVSKEGGTGVKVGNFVNTWGNEMKENRMKEKTKKRQKTLERFGMGEKTMESLQVVAKDEKVKRATGFVKGAVLGAGVGVATGGLGLAAAATAGAIPGGSLGYLYQRGREFIGGRMEAWSQKKIDDKTAKVKDFEKTRDEDLVRSDRHKEEDMRVANREKNDALAGLREHTGAGQNLMAAENLSHEFTKDNSTDKKAFENNLRGRGFSEEMVKQEVGAQERRLNDNVVEAEKSFNDLEEVKKVNDAHKIETERINKSHEGRKKETEEIFTSNLKVNNLDGRIGGAITKGLRDFGKNMKNYNPNHITLEAAKQGTEQIRAAADRRKKLATDSGSIEDFNPEHLYSTSGVTSGQQKFYDKLSDGSKEAADAINNMAKSLAKFSSGLQRPSAEQQKRLVALKQLIASQISAGKSTDHLSGVIGHLDKINTRDKKDRIKVEDFVEKKT